MFFLSRVFLKPVFHARVFVSLQSHQHSLTQAASHDADTIRFHDIVRQPSLPALPPAAMSKLVISRALPTVHFPMLQHNTLVLSTCGVVHQLGKRLCLSFRVGDTYGYQVVEGHARLYLYRWTECPGGALDYGCTPLDVGYHHGEERLLLRLPTLVSHTIDEQSPLANWLRPGTLVLCRGVGCWCCVRCDERSLP